MDENKHGNTFNVKLKGINVTLIYLGKRYWQPFSGQRGIFVAGLREEIVTSPEQVLQMMEFGEGIENSFSCFSIHAI